MACRPRVQYLISASLFKASGQGLGTAWTRMAQYSSGRISVIIPARNEERNIARVVSTVAIQQDVREILVVDDQSTDGTVSVVEKLSQDLQQLRVIRLDGLPAGWLGKTYAAAMGAREARGEWLLFTDADTEYVPHTLHELLGRAEREGIQLLSLSPGQVMYTWWEKAVLPMVYVWLAERFRFEEVNDPASPVAAANGQFILIRRNTYERVGGHEAVRDKILEDVALARAVKSSGGRLLFLPGRDWVRTRMYRTFPELWEGWSKNLYLLAGESIRRLLTTVAGFCLLDYIPLMAMPLCGFAAAVDLMDWKLAVPLMIPGVISYVGRGARYSRAVGRLGFEPGIGDYRLPGSLLFTLLLLNSAWRFRRNGEVTWKGRTYPARI
jgi:cellulose synthase/poly-beta-1,6-N-acetylglucosamine synthase-like glycosyltransferase